MSSDAISGIGASFKRYDGSQWVALAEVTGSPSLSKTRATHEVTSYDSTGGYREFIGGLRDGGEFTITMNFTAASFAIVNDDFEDDDIQEYQLSVADGVPTTLRFSAWVTNLSLEAPVDGIVSCSVTFKVSGQTELNPS